MIKLKIHVMFLLFHFFNSLRWFSTSHKIFFPCISLFTPVRVVGVTQWRANVLRVRVRSAARAERVVNALSGYCQLAFRSTHFPTQPYPISYKVTLTSPPHAPSLPHRHPHCARASLRGIPLARQPARCSRGATALHCR